MSDVRARPLLPTLVLVAALAVALGACGGSRPPTPEPTPPAPDAGDAPLRVYFMDVGQGDGALVITPNGHTILIDAGPPQAGAAVVATLRRLGVRRINLMVTSHAHADHIGGFDAVLNAFEVMRYADPGFPHTSSMYANLLERVAAAGIDAYAFTVGRWLQLDEGVQMLVLAPPERYLGGTRSDVNSNSIVLLLRYGDVQILFTGDSEADTERAMMRDGVLGDIDVLKVAHHGGAYSTTARFLEVVQPEVAVISCGAGNSYGHPAHETLERLEVWAGDRVFRTDVQGTIVLETDGRHVLVYPERERLEARQTTTSAAP
jgi:competence protein ComEC